MICRKLFVFKSLVQFLQEYSLIVLFLLALQRGNVFTVKCYHQLLFCESKLSHFQTDKNFY